MPSQPLCAAFLVGQIPELLLEQQLPGQTPAAHLFVGTAVLHQLSTCACVYESPEHSSVDAHTLWEKKGSRHSPARLPPLPQIPEQLRGACSQGTAWSSQQGSAPKRGSSPLLCPRSSLSRPCTTSWNHRIIESQGWKGPARSSSPTVSITVATTGTKPYLVAPHPDAS